MDRLLLFVLICTFFAMVNVGLAGGLTRTEEEDVRNFRRLVDVMAHDGLRVIEELPSLIAAGRRLFEDGSRISSGTAEGHRRGSVVDKSYEVPDLYREAKDSVYKVAVRGRTLLRNMVNHNIDEMQRAFDEGKYEIIRVRLGDVREKLKEAKEALESDSVKMKFTNAAKTTGDISRLIHSQMAEKLRSAKDAEQGWGAGNSAVTYTFGVVVGAGAVALAPYAVPALAYGVAAGAGYGAAAGVGVTGLWQITDKLDRQGLQQRFHSEAQELSVIDGEVRYARGIIHHCAPVVEELQVGVEDAQTSTERISGYLKPTDADMFKSLLSDAKRNYKRLLVWYEEIVKSIESGSSSQSD